MTPIQLETQVKKTLREIKLSRKEHVIVALSGGKDSSVVAYLLKKFGYNIEGFHIDLKIGKYSDDCLEKVQELCKQLDIKLHVYDMKKEAGAGMCYLRSAVQSKKNLKNCAICGVVKKWILNREARKLKAKKIATGHHLNDEAQTFFLNILKGSPELSANSGSISRNLPDKKFIPRIKPLFMIPEDEIRKYSLKEKLPVNYSKCPCAIDSYRIQIREFMETLSIKEKENIMANREKILEGLAKKSNEVNYCSLCGEPSRKEICKRCELMRLENSVRHSKLDKIQEKFSS